MEQEELDSLNEKLLACEDINEMKLLLEAGADVNAQDYWGCTALMYAKDAEQTKLLLEAGADINARDEDGRTVLMFANDAEQTKLLLEAGADVNAQTEGGKTALMCAEDAEQTKLLLEAGADINARDEDGYTALMCAQNAEQAKLLLEAGADAQKGCYLSKGLALLRDLNEKFIQAKDAEQKAARTAKIASMRKRLADGKALGTKSEAVENPDKIKKPEGKISMCINKSNER